MSDASDDGKEEGHTDRRTEQNVKKRELVDFLQENVRELKRKKQVKKYFEKLLLENGTRKNRGNLFACAIEVLHMQKVVEIIEECDSEYIASIAPHNAFSRPQNQKSTTEMVTDIGFARKIVILKPEDFKRIMTYFLFYDDANTNANSYSVFKKQCLSEVGWGLYVPDFYSITNQAEKWTNDMQNNGEWFEKEESGGWEEYFNSLPWPLLAPLVRKGTVMEYLGIPSVKDFSEPAKALWGNKGQQLGRFTWVDTWEKEKMQSFFINGRKSESPRVYYSTPPEIQDDVNGKGATYCPFASIRIPDSGRKTVKNQGSERKRKAPSISVERSRRQWNKRKVLEDHSDDEQGSLIDDDDQNDDDIELDLHSQFEKDDFLLPNDIEAGSPEPGKYNPMLYANYEGQPRRVSMFDSRSNAMQCEERDGIIPVDGYMEEANRAVLNSALEDEGFEQEEFDSEQESAPKESVMDRHQFAALFENEDRQLLQATQTDWNDLAKTWNQSMTKIQTERVDQLFEVLFTMESIDDNAGREGQLDAMTVMLKALQRVGCLRIKEMRWHAIRTLDQILADTEGEPLNAKTLVLTWVVDTLKYSWKIREKSSSGKKKNYYVDIAIDTTQASIRHKDLLTSILHNLKKKLAPHGEPWALGQQAFSLKEIVALFSEEEYSYGYPRFLTDPLFYRYSILDIKRTNQAVDNNRHSRMPTSKHTIADASDSEEEPEASVNSRRLKNEIQSLYTNELTELSFGEEEKKCLKEIVEYQMRTIEFADLENILVLMKLALGNWKLSESRDYTTYRVFIHPNTTTFCKLSISTLLWFLPLQWKSINRLLKYYFVDPESHKIEISKTNENTELLRHFEWLRAQPIENTNPGPRIYIQKITEVHLASHGKYIDSITVTIPGPNKRSMQATVLPTLFSTQDTAKAAALEFIRANKHAKKKECAALKQLLGK